MNKLFFIITILFAVLLTGCVKGEVNKVQPQKGNTVEHAEKVKTESVPSEVHKIENLIKNYLLAYNSEDKKSFSVALKNVFQQEYIPHYIEEFEYHQLTDVRDITFENSRINPEESKLSTDVIFMFIDGDGSPREYKKHVVASFREFDKKNYLTFLYFYEDEKEVDNKFYTAYQSMTKNPPIANYGSHSDLNSIVNPIGLNETEEVEFSIYRQLIMLYEAQYLEIDPKEYNRKAKQIFHHDVLSDYIIQDTSEPINGNLNKLEITTIEAEQLTRTTENVHYKGYYNFSFYDIEGNEMRQTGEISAVFKQAKDGMKLVTFRFENY